MAAKCRSRRNQRVWGRDGYEDDASDAASTMASMRERFETILQVDAAMQIESNDKVMGTRAQRSGLSGISAL